MARVMPSNKEAEMSVLGVTFIDNSLVEKICDEINADMFFDERNKFLFEAIEELYKKNIPIDMNMVKEELDKKKRLTAVGGIEYITEVIDSVITTANLSHYINILKEHATRRNLINAATEIVTEAYEEENVTTVIDNAERNIPMYMKDWKKEVDTVLTIRHYDILEGKGKISKKEADEKAENEYEKYKIIQDKKFVSDFDMLLLEAENLNKIKKNK